MKYFVTLIIIVLGAIIAWFAFFSERANDKMIDNKEIKPVADLDSSTVILETEFGSIKLALDASVAPQTVTNFTKLVSEGFYNNLSFHRIVPGFVIQGGDPQGDGTDGPGYTIPAEIKLTHKRGSVAMARLSDEVNPSRASSGSQFYIALQDLPNLDGQYTVFGQVIEGMEAVERISAVETDVRDRPLEPVIIKEAYLE